MRWLPFAVGAWLALGLELGLAPQLAWHVRTVTIQPSFLLPLAVFVAMGAAANHAVWACLVLGLLLDLTWRWPASTLSDTLTVLGPHALGYLVAGQFVLAMRSMMIRRNPLALAALAVAASLISGVTIVAVFAIRDALGDIVVWSTWTELLGRMGASIYTGVVALVMGFVLLRLAPVFGFTLGPRGMPRRAYERR
ncbi:MAG: hypothetical protein ACKVU4_09260 [Phycisphaerales bacterium]